MKTLLVSMTLLALANPAFAADPAAGEKTFAKCKACHSIQAPDGTAVVKGGKVGPNLYGVIGRKVGSVEDFKYSPATIAAGETGAIWDEAALAAYLVDPSKWLQEKTGDTSAKSKMTFKLATGGEDVAAYLAQFK